jgi:hypothetical protein
MTKNSMSNPLERITMVPGNCHGKPTIWPSANICPKHTPIHTKKIKKSIGYPSPDANDRNQ